MPYGVWQQMFYLTIPLFRILWKYISKQHITIYYSWLLSNIPARSKSNTNRSPSVSAPTLSLNICKTKCTWNSLYNLILNSVSLKITLKLCIQVDIPQTPNSEKTLANYNYTYHFIDWSANSFRFMPLELNSRTNLLAERTQN